MLQQLNDAIVEASIFPRVIDFTPTTTTNAMASQYFYPDPWPTSSTIYWQSYPVYVCTDKTKKAIEILKTLQADKLLECKSVGRFIELVEKIAALL